MTDVDLMSCSLLSGWWQVAFMTTNGDLRLETNVTWLIHLEGTNLFRYLVLRVFISFTNLHDEQTGDRKAWNCYYNPSCCS
jgi:hypothetical protein